MPSSPCLRCSLSEALFVETLRQYVASLPAEETGWLAGARDPVVGRSLAILHSRVDHPWTIAELAKEVGISRSALLERFDHDAKEDVVGWTNIWWCSLGLG